MKSDQARPTRSCIPLVVLLAAAVAGCPPAGPGSPNLAAEPLDPRSVVGCYRRDHERFGLDTIPAQVTLLQAPEGARQAWSYFHHSHNAYWKILPDNTVEYVAGNSLHGHRIRGVFRGDSIVGRLSGWTDLVGVRSRSYRVVARREPCSADGSPEPPPSATALRDSLAPAIAAAVLEPLLPSVRRGVPLGVRPTRFRFGYDALAAGILARHPEVRSPAAPDDTSAIWVRLEDAVVSERDSASAVASVCGHQQGADRRDERARYRLVRVGATWRFAGTQPLPDGESACVPPTGG